MNAYENLANAIIVQACKDYRDELSCLAMNPPVTEDDRENDEYIKHQTEKAAIEAFFQWSDDEIKSRAHWSCPRTAATLRDTWHTAQ